MGVSDSKLSVTGWRGAVMANIFLLSIFSATMEGGVFALRERGGPLVFVTTMALGTALMSLYRKDLARYLKLVHCEA